MASGVMQIKYSEERIASRASKACNELEDICSSLSKVRKKIGGIEERSRSGDNLSRASAFLRKKTQQYERRSDALETLKTRSNSFMSKVETTEKKLSSQIKKEYNKFNKQTGIGKTATAAFFSNIGKGLKKGLQIACEALTYLIPGYGQYKMIKKLWETGKKVVEAIKNWYMNLPEGVRFALEAIGAVAVAVVAVIGLVTGIGAAVTAIGAAVAAVGAALSAASVATAVISAVFATVSAVGAAIGAADALINAGKQAGEAGMFFMGDKNAARELNSMSTGEFMGTTFGFDPKIYDNIVTAGSVCSLVGGLGTFGLKVQQGVFEGGKVTGFKGKLKAYGDSFKHELGEKFKGLTGIDDFKDMRSYQKQHGTWSLFTQDIDFKNFKQMDAFKGLTTLHDWVTLDPFVKGAGIIDNFLNFEFGTGAKELFNWVF